MKRKATAAALAAAISNVQVKPDVIVLSGGQDVVTPPMQRAPGLCKDAQNFEADINGGYRRVRGYERTDGRPAPSEALYSILTANISGAPVVGNTLTGATSGATGVIIALPGGSFVLTKVTGVFLIGENLNVGGPTIAVATSTANASSASTPLLHAQYKNLAADVYRADIAAVPGSGNTLGGFYFNDVNYAFRNNAGGTAAELYKSTAGGWAKVNFEFEIAYTAGSGSVDDGDVLTQGGVTATVRRVLVRTGTLAGASAVGTLVISAPAGGNFAAGAATTTGGGTLTLSGVQTAITLLPNGRFETVKENFFGSTTTKRVYGVDGVNRAWEFDGSFFVPIPTGMAVDTPNHVKAHKKHLFLSFVGSVQFSGDGAPFAWSLILGAGELGMGDDVTGFGASFGSDTGAALPIFTRNRLSVLYGSSSVDFDLVPYKDEIGAFAYTIQDAGFQIFLDDQGITDIQATQSYGNFAHAAISNRVRPLVTALKALSTASVVSRDRSQYRLFFSTKAAFYMTLVGRKVVGIMSVLFADVVRCCWSAEKNDGTEVLFFGTDGGLVMQMEKGTSFDGQDIEFFFTLAHNFQGSPRVEKTYHDAMLELSSTGYAAFNLGFELGYLAPEIPQPAVQTVVANFGFVAWDSFTWDFFNWDGSTLSPSVVDVSASAENIAIALRGNADYMEPFIVSGALINYTPRKRLRP